MRRLGAIIIAAGALLLLLVGPAQAQDPYSGTLTGGGGRGSAVAPGSTHTVSGGGYAPGATVTFTIDGITLGTAVAGADGVATLSFTVPDLDPGCYTVTASGAGAQGGTRVNSTSLCIAGAGRTLATTGPEHLWRNVGIGGILVVIGTALIVTIRRRRVSGATA